MKIVGYAYPDIQKLMGLH